LTALEYLRRHAVIPGRRQRIRAKRGPMVTNPESRGVQNVWIPGLRARARIPE